MALRPWRRLLAGILAVALLDALLLAAVLSQALEGEPADLRFSQGTEVTTLDPAESTALNDGRAISALFEGLTVVDPATMKARPGVARRWTVSPDGLVYTFTFRDDARWSDGKPVTPDDFLYAWRRVLHVKTAAQYNYMLFPIRGAKDYADATAHQAALKNETVAAAADAVRTRLRELVQQRVTEKGAASEKGTPSEKAESTDKIVLTRQEIQKAVTDSIEAVEAAALSPEAREALVARAAKVVAADLPDAAEVARLVDAALKKREIAVLTLDQADDRVPRTLKALGLAVRSPRVLEVTLAQPTHYFPELVAFVTYLPVRQDCVEIVRDGRTVDDPRWVFPGRIISNGPYVLKEWVYKSRMRLQKSPTYWDRDQVRLNLVDLYPIDDANTCLVNYESGDLDFITVVPTLAAEQLLKESRAGRRTDLQVAPNLGTYYYRFNCTRKPLDDVRVRKALALAVDKEEIVVKAGRMGQPVCGVLVPPGIPGYTGPKGQGHDGDLARKLLAEAGFPGGQGFPRLTVLYNTLDAHKAVAELAQQSWKRELGIDVELVNVEWKVFLQRVRDLKYDIARAGWYGDYVDPNTFLDMFVTDGGNNNTGWSNAEYDRLIKQAAETLDPAQRMKVFLRAEKLLVEDELPIMPLYHYVGPMLAKPYVKGWCTNLRNDLLFQDMWIDRPGGRP